MTHPVFVVPGSMEALKSLHAAADNGSVPLRTHELIILRASQINGCSGCVDMHARDLAAHGETPERINAVAAWRDTAYYTEAERAALALTECVTRLSDRPDPVPDDVWAEAARHYDEAALGALLVSIASINVWNRLNVATKQIAGEHAS